MDEDTPDSWNESKTKRKEYLDKCGTAEEKSGYNDWETKHQKAAEKAWEEAARKKALEGKDAICMVQTAALALAATFLIIN